MIKLQVIYLQFNHSRNIMDSAKICVH